jgi:hypothetical protein
MRGKRCHLDHQHGLGLQRTTKPSPTSVGHTVTKPTKGSCFLPLPPILRRLPNPTPLCRGGGEMAKSLRSKREKRLRTLRREIAEPFYDKKEAAKLAAQAAALEAPKVPVRAPPQSQDAGSSRVAASSSASAMGEPSRFSGLLTLSISLFLMEGEPLLHRSL